MQVYVLIDADGIVKGVVSSESFARQWVDSNPYCDADPFEVDGGVAEITKEILRESSRRAALKEGLDRCAICEVERPKERPPGRRQCPGSITAWPTEIRSRAPSTPNNSCVGYGASSSGIYAGVFAPLMGGKG